VDANGSRPCPGCLATVGRVAGEVDGFAMVRCARCRTLFTARLPPAADAKDYGDFYAQARDVAVPAFVLDRLADAVAGFERYRSDTNGWLDIGCGTGTLLRAAVNRGWQPVGTEVAAAAVDAVRAQGLDARLGETGELDLPENHYDVVSLIEVIEHVHDPDGLLADAARLVRPGGAVYLTTPNGRSLAGRVLGMRWSTVVPPEHLQLFSTAGLSAALRRAGLRVRSVATTGINPFEIRAGLRSGRDRAEAETNTETSYRLNESMSTRPAAAAVKRGVNGMLSATRLGDTLKVVAERDAL
jgi:SAM-dependent methyltransferase